MRKGQAAIEHLYHPDRLKYPLKKEGSDWIRISWEQAFSEIAEKLNALKEKYGPSVIAFFCGSIGVENLEMISLTHRFKAALGSPNFFSVESICYRMRIRARQITFGKYRSKRWTPTSIYSGAITPPRPTSPSALAMEENIKKGARVIVIDPRRLAIADRAETYLAIRPGTDGALALALMNVMINENLYDKEFVDKWTYGFDKLVPHVQQYTPEWAEKITSVKASDIRILARRFATTKGHPSSTAPARRTSAQTGARRTGRWPSSRYSQATSTCPAGGSSARDCALPT